MFNQESIKKLLKVLENDDEKFIDILDKIIMGFVKLANSLDDLREELIGLDDIYQTFIEDANFSYWLEVSEGKLYYEKGVNSRADFKMTFSKELIIKILKGEISGTEEFMKGKINVDGDLSQGLHYIKLFRIIFKFLKARSTKN